MKIALVSPYDMAYPGGVANHILALEHQLTRMGHEVKVIAPISKANSNLSGKFIPIGKPWPFPSSGSVARITVSPWLSYQVKAVLDREKFDIIHLHEPLCPMLCTTVLRLSRVANVGTFHAVDSRGYTLWWPFTSMFLKKWFPRLHGKIAVSGPATAFANKHFPGEYTIIPNGVDLENFSADVPPVDEFIDGKINIVFVGRLEKRKGLNYLLGAYNRIRQQVPDSRLIIVGPGTRWSDSYEEMIRRNGVPDVVFVGYVPYEELPRYYKTADIVCFPATGRESFGIVLLEAMAVGKPVVASNIDGYASLLTHGAQGLLVPPRNEEALAQALLSLIADEQLRHEMGTRGKAKALEYGWETVATRVVEFYNKVLDEHSQKQLPTPSHYKFGGFETPSSSPH
jgi:phosphatidylinositol alpha-mannosyltransferase